jgi:quercetin dioxygenase-like cupin family protein
VFASRAIVDGYTATICGKCFLNRLLEKPIRNIQYLHREETALYEVILKRFEHPDEVRTFPKGKFELIHINGMTIGRATYEPGSKWSEHVGRATGAKSCSVEHVGMVVSGRATAAMDDGRVIEMKPGDIFYIAPGHDSWVVGGQPYVSLHLIGAADYAQHK